jgi:hypothetical protein
LKAVYDYHQFKLKCDHDNRTRTADFYGEGLLAVVAMAGEPPWWADAAPPQQRMEHLGHINGRFRDYGY